MLGLLGDDGRLTTESDNVIPHAVCEEYFPSGMRYFGFALCLFLTVIRCAC